MQKKELSEAVAIGADISQAKGEEVVNILLNMITQQLTQKSSVQLSGFGSFTVKHRASRIGRNPKNGTVIQIPESVAIRFTPGKAFKDHVNAVID